MQQPVETQLKQVINMLARRRWLILSAGLLGAALAAGLGTLIPAEYTAKAQIVIDPQQISLASSNVGVTLPVNDLAIETQVAMIASRDHLRHVREGLLAEPEFRGAAAEPQDLPDGTAIAGAIEPAQAAGPEVPTVDELEAGLRAYQERESRVIAVTFTWTDPVQAAVIANQLAGMHVATIVDLKNIANGRASFETELAYLQHQLSLAKSDLTTRQSQLAVLQDMRPRLEARDQFIAALDSSLLTELREREITQQQARAETSPTYPAGAPKALAFTADSQELRDQIDREADRLMEQLAHETQIATGRVRSLEERVSAVQGAHRRSRELGTVPAPVRPELFQNEDAYANLLLRQQKEMREQPETSPGMHILAVAEAPNSPSTTNPLLFVFPAFVAFTIAGGLVATLLEGTDRRLRSARDIENTLSINCIGLVPQPGRFSNARDRDDFRQRPFAPYTEAIRSVVTTALELGASPPHARLFLVTSSIAGEGKAALAASFAAYAASLDRRVILVNLAFKSRALHDRVNGQSLPDDFDPFKGRAWQEAITYVPDLEFDYLPLQTSPADPVALLSGPQFPELLNELRERYDCVVIHADPLLSATASRLLVPMVDKVLLVVKWGRTRSEVAQNAMSLLEPYLRGRGTAVIVGAVVTNVCLKKHAAYRNGDAAEFLAKEPTHCRPVYSAKARKNATGRPLFPSATEVTTYAKP